MPEKILFIDRDGTLIVEPEDQQVDQLEKIQLLPNVIPALRRIIAHDFRLVMVSNQDGLGTRSFAQHDFDRCQQHVLNLFESQGVVFKDIFICPHLAEEKCDCRKPKTGLLTQFLAQTDLDVNASAVIGDRDTDLQLSANLGLRGIKISSEEEGMSWTEVADSLCNHSRQAQIERTTRETSICAKVDLDIEAPIKINSGIGFYDHMLEQIAKHGGFSLQLECTGDLAVDEHHTVEDTAICVGSAVRQALGNKHGLSRYGFLLPMDESEAKVSLDLSGRAYFVFEGQFSREYVGELPTELVPHFFRSFSESLGAALHIKVQGENTHHMVEACFKAVGRAMRQALRRDGDALPSTKGTLS